MATVILTTNIPSQQTFTLPFYKVELGVHTTGDAAFTAPGGETVIFGGESFVYKDNHLLSGTIHQAIFKDGFGGITAQVTGLNLEAGQLGLTPLSYIEDFAAQALSGDDTVTGSSGADVFFAYNGNDTLLGLEGEDRFIGERGDDTMTGGIGRDSFHFANGGSGHDIITDFDTEGKHFEHDVIEITEQWEIHKSGKHNTLIDFDDGESSILLLHVKLHDLNKGDIVLDM